jgi:hypothetical protein
MQIVSIEVVDTTSSVYYPDAESFGIKIYPNPVDHVLTISIPNEIRELEYAFMDIHGRLLRTGKASSGKVLLDLSGLPCAVYTLKLSETSTGREFRARRILIN